MNQELSEEQVLACAISREFTRQNVEKAVGLSALILLYVGQLAVDEVSMEDFNDLLQDFRDLYVEALAAKKRLERRGELSDD